MASPRRRVLAEFPADHELAGGLVGQDEIDIFSGNGRYIIGRAGIDHDHVVPAALEFDYKNYSIGSEGI